MGEIMRSARLLLFLLLITGISTLQALAGSAQVRNRDGSLVLEAPDSRGSAPKDTLHSLLTREVQVYIFKNNTRLWPQPQTYGAGTPLIPAAKPSRLAGPFLENLIQKYAQKHGVDPHLVRAVMRHESGFNPWAVSPKGAQGLMQLMPDTAAQMGVKNPFDPEENLAGGVGYLKFCLNRFQNNIPLAVAAYNAGPERVAKAGGIPAIPETQLFVTNVLGTYTGKPQPLPPTQAAPATAPKGQAPLSARVLATTPPAAPDHSQAAAPRPRAKVIEVRFPKGKKLAAAKPRQDD